MMRVNSVLNVYPSRHSLPTDLCTLFLEIWAYNVGVSIRTYEAEQTTSRA